MKKKIKIKLMILLVFALIFISNVYAYSGISPAKIELNFEPFKEDIIKFKLFGYNDIDIELGCPDILSVHKIEPVDNYHNIYLNLKFQDKLPTPGKNICSIRFFEKNLNINPNGLATATAVGGKLIINVPYPGLFAELDLNAHNINKDEQLNFHIVVHNKGEQILKDIKVDVDIYDSNNNLVDKISTDTVSIPPFEYRDTNLIWESKNFDPGRYKANAKLDYGGDELAIDNENFIIGKIYVGFLNATKQGKPYQINPFNIIVESWWGDIIKNVFAEVFIKNESDIELGHFKTISVDLNPWEIITLNGFFDASYLGEGKYKAKIIINYEENQSIQEWDFELKEDKNKNPFWNNFTDIISNPIYLLIIIIVIIISIDIIYLLKRKRKK